MSKNKLIFTARSLGFIFTLSAGAFSHYMILSGILAVIGWNLLTTAVDFINRTEQ